MRYLTWDGLTLFRAFGRMAKYAIDNSLNPYCLQALVDGKLEPAMDFEIQELWAAIHRNNERQIKLWKTSEKNMNMRRQRKGALTVEMAVVGSVFVLLVGAIMECGRIGYVMNAVNSAANKSARVASIDEDNIRAYSRAEGLLAAVGVNNCDVSVARIPSGGSAPGSVTVTVSTNARDFSFFGLDFPIRGVSTRIDETTIR